MAICLLIQALGEKKNSLCGGHQEDNQCLCCNPHQFRVYGLPFVVVVARLKLLVRHELDGAMGNAPDARDEPFVVAPDALLLADLQEGVQHALVSPCGALNAWLFI